MRRALSHHLLWLSLAAPLLGGCGQPCARDLPLDRDVARQSLEGALEAWKTGKTPADLKDQDIVVGDQAWESGAKLIAYRFLEADRDDGTNLHSMVELVLEYPQAGELRQEVTYIVGTSPFVTIFRK